MKEKLKNVWDTIYAEGGYGELVPDQELVDICQSLPVGRALDVGAGEGRHSLWLASQGWNVDALDVSAVGLESLRSQAKERGLQVNCILGSAAGHSFVTAAYDLIVSTGVVLNFFKKSEGKAIIRSLIDGLKIRGILYVSVATPNDPGNRKYREQAASIEDDSFFCDKTGTWITAYSVDDLRECCASCELLFAFEKEIQDNHGEPHTHVMAYMAARKT